MNPKTILILGGYGNTGRPLARLLLQESDAHISLAGRNIQKAKAFAGELHHIYPGNRVQAACIDAADPTSLRLGFNDVNLVVVASSTTPYTQRIARAALEAGIDYIDIQYSPQKIAALHTLSDEIRQAGRCFITDGGFHPGLPAMMVRYAAMSFDKLISARVGSVIKENWKSLEVGEATIDELMEMMDDFEMLVFKAGEWKKVSMLSTADFICMDFGEVFGKQFCAPMMLEEMRRLPEMYPTLRETGFYVGSFNWFVDWVIMPIAMIGMKLNPRAALRPMGKWMHWGLNTFTKPPYGTLLQVEAAGEKAGQPKKLKVAISHPDGYLFTAIPVAACLLQYLDGSIAEPGLWLQAHVVEPTRFMTDMQHMGIAISTIDGGTNELESH